MNSTGKFLAAELLRSTITDTGDRPQWSQRMRANYDVRSGEIQSMQQAGTRLCARLQRHNKNLGPNLAVVKRLIVRNSSQHKRGVSFQLLRRTSRVLHRYVDMNMQHTMQQFLDGFPHISTMGTNVSGKDLPSYRLFGVVLRALLGATALAQVIIDHCMMTFRACSGDLANALFMPLNITCIAAVSSISAEIRAHQRLLVSAYKAIYICTTWSNFGGFNDRPLKINETTPKSKRQKNKGVEACRYPARIEEWILQCVATEANQRVRKDVSDCEKGDALKRHIPGARAEQSSGDQNSRSAALTSTMLGAHHLAKVSGDEARLLDAGAVVDTVHESQPISRLDFALDFRQQTGVRSSSDLASSSCNRHHDSVMDTALAVAALSSSDDDEVGEQCGAHVGNGVVDDTIVVPVVPPAPPDHASVVEPHADDRDQDAARPSVDAVSSAGHERQIEHAQRKQKRVHPKSRVDEHKRKRVKDISSATETRKNEIDDIFGDF
eukprot:m.1373677 g.1373677  ORF g.1373677 m.1373677 type:complete len:494 (+) comp24956_c0_seq8:84-1565(+)